MTRFARAKGSKSSNERAPEDSTPWEVMKEQLQQAKKDSEEAKNREKAEQKRIENYENFLKEHKSQKRQATWCDFPEATSNKLTVPEQLEPLSKKKKKNKQKQQNGSPQPVPTSNTLLEDNATSTTSPSKKSKKKKQKKQKSLELAPSSQEKFNGAELAEPTTEGTTEGNMNANSPKKTNMKKIKQKQNSEEELEKNQLKDSNHSDKPQVSNQNIKKRNKKNKKQMILSEDTHTQEKKDNNVGQNAESNKANQTSNKQKKKEKKLVDGVPVRRKPINDNSFQLIINGKEVELVRFDGFPIMKKDAERIKELKNNMIKKGIPKSEVNRTLKLERRRAEKALARLKRDVCYNCRKGGHNLSDCPELKTKIPGVGAADGVCFKCGSTEHRQFECKVQKDNEFRFASCFICKEPGHIARQCPDNPKGLYPNGGGCKLCGDVTHLRKDCPTMMGKKEETSIKLQTLDSNDNLEEIEQKMTTNPQETTKKPKKIKF